LTLYQGTSMFWKAGRLRGALVLLAGFATLRVRCASVELTRGGHIEKRKAAEWVRKQKRSLKTASRPARARRCFEVFEPL